MAFAFVCVVVCGVVACAFALLCGFVVVVLWLLLLRVVLFAVCGCCFRFVCVCVWFVLFVWLWLL